MGCGTEAKERKIVVQKVAPPDGKGVENIQRGVANMPYRHDALPKTLEHFLHLVEHTHLASQYHNEHNDGRCTHKGYYPACRRKAVYYFVDACSRCLEEGIKGFKLQQKGEHGYQ